MAILSLKTLGLWFHNLFIVILLYFINLQRMVTVVDYEYYKSRALFFLFSFYLFIVIYMNLFKIYEKHIDIKIKKQTLRAKKEIADYISNKNKK